MMYINTLGRLGAVVTSTTKLIAVEYKRRPPRAAGLNKDKRPDAAYADAGIVITGHCSVWLAYIEGRNSRASGGQGWK